MACTSICPVCNEPAVIVDHTGDEECSVCAECGTVVQEHVFQSKADAWINEGYQHVSELHKAVPKHLKHVHAAREPEGLIIGRKRAKKTARRFMSNSEMVTAAVDLYERAYRSPVFKKLFVSNKIILSDCCVFVVGRQNYSELSLTMKEFCLLTKQSVYEFGTVYKRLLSVFDIKLPFQSMGCVISYYVSKANLPRGIADVVSDIVSLCQERLLMSSTHRDILVVVAAYLAWSSWDLAENKTKILTIKQFTSKFNFTFSKGMTTQLKQVTDVLTKIGQNLPWANNLQNKKHFVLFNLKDIIKYKRSLLFEQIMQKDTEEELTIVCKAEDIDTINNCQSIRSDKPCKRSYDQNRTEESEVIGSVKKSRTSCEPNDDSSDESDIERLVREVDENIDKYIRSDEDVKRLKKEGFMW